MSKTKPSSAPKVLILNYDENGSYAKNHQQSKGDIIDKINEEEWDLVILCTQKSLSNLISISADTMQHVIGEEMKNNIELNNTYKLFSKIDATRPENSKKIIFSNNKKFRSVRVRCWINYKTVFIPSKINQDFIKSTSYKSTNNSFENYYVTDNYNNSQISDKIKLVKYQYKRLTEEDDIKRQKGEGAIIVSFILKKGKEKYQYVVCNYDSTSINLSSLDENILVQESKKEYFKQLLNKDNNKKNRKDKNKIVNLSKPTNIVAAITPNKFIRYNKKVNIDNLFLSYLSCNSIVYEYLKKNNDPSFYNSLLKVNSRKKISKSKDNNLTLEQITYWGVSNQVNQSRASSEALPFNPSTAENIQQIQSTRQNSFSSPLIVETNKDKLIEYNIIFSGLKEIIKNILSKCERPINREKINRYINNNLERLSRYYKPSFYSISRNTFNYSFILNLLIEIKKNLYDSLETSEQEELDIYLSIWKLIDEKFWWDINTKDEKRKSNIKNFINKYVNPNPSKTYNI
jgi:hypothetical protein